MSVSSLLISMLTSIPTGNLGMLAAGKPVQQDPPIAGLTVNLALRQQFLREYQVYYNESRTHLSLEKNSPVPRRVEPVSKGRVVATPQVGGLHHLYSRAA